MILSELQQYICQHWKTSVPLENLSTTECSTSISSVITDCETRLSHLHRTPWTDETLTDFCSSKLHSRQRDKNPNHFSFFFKLQQNKPPIIQMMQKTFKKGKIFQVPETLCVCNGHCLKTMRVINGIINQILFLK